MTETLHEFIPPTPGVAARRQREVSSSLQSHGTAGTLHPRSHTD